MGAIRPRAGDLIGRDEELATALELLDDGVRLLTLTGPPGVGKTRLALAVAEIASRDGRSPDGVVFVDLSSSVDAVGALAELARSLGVGGVSGERAGPIVEQWLTGRRMLLVLDNAEQVADLAPELLTLLDASPHVQVLVTSRENMHLSRERELSVPPLRMPSDAEAADLAQVSQVPSVAMFTSLARAAAPDFELTTANARAIAEICVRLDGLPLALTLAAARIKLFTPDEMAARLRDRRTVLEATDRDVPARHRTLHAAISWSYADLSADESQLFRRLSVFAGPWSLEAAERVCGLDAESVVPLVTSLIDKSLVSRVEVDDAEAHFAMLQSVRDFAAEQLADSADRDATADRHLRYFFDLSVAAEGRIATKLESLWGEDVSRYEGDTRAARQRSIECDDGVALMALTTALAWAWYLSGQIGAAQTAIAEAAANLPDEGERANSDQSRAFAIIAGIVAWATGDLATAKRLLDDAHARCAEAGDDRRLASALAFLGNVARDRGDYDEAARCHRAAGELYDTLDSARGAAWARFDLSRVDWQRGEVDAAIRLSRDALDRFRRLDYPWAVAWARWVLGTQLIESGRDSDGGPLVAAAMVDFELVPDYRGLALCWESLGVLACRRSLHADAARLAAAADAVRTRLVIPRTEAEAHRVEQVVGLVRSHLGDLMLDREFHHGQTMPASEVHDLARRLVGEVAGPTADGPDRPSWDTLTAREREVAALVAEGCTNQQIGNRLGITARTAEAHVHNIMTKLDARSRAEVAVWVVTSRRPA